MKVSNRNIDIGDDKVHTKLHRRPVSLLVNQGANDTHDISQSDVNSDKKNIGEMKIDCMNDRQNEYRYEQAEYDIPAISTADESDVDAIDVKRIIIVSADDNNNRNHNHDNATANPCGYQDCKKIHRNDNELTANRIAFKQSKHDASIHVHRFGYAALVCSIAWTACSAMGANCGIINQSTGVASAATATVIAVYQIAHKVRNR